MLPERFCESLCSTETRALQYAIPANCLLIGALSLLLPLGPLSAALVLDAFLLVLAAIGITGHVAVLIVPNMAIKILLLLIMLFIGCVSIDTFHAHYIKEAAGISGNTEVVSQSPVSLWRGVVHTYPSLPLWIIAFVFIIIIEIRLCFCAWYRIAFGTHTGNVKETERRPPSYAYCVSHSNPSTCSIDELPSYEEAVRRSSFQKPSSSTMSPPSRSAPPQCCSTTKRALVSPFANTTPKGKSPQLMKSDTFRYRESLSSSQMPYRWRPQRIVAIQIEHLQSSSHRCKSSSGSRLPKFRERTR